MDRKGTTELQPYLAHLKALPFVRGVRVEQQARGADPPHADALVRLRTPKGECTLRAEIKRTHLTQTLVDGFLARARPLEKGRWILLAPHVGRKMGGYLRENHTNYLDVAGNCYLTIDRDYLALVEGKRPERKGPAARGVRGPGHQVLFAVLARPDLLDAPVRKLAGAAGVGKTAAAEMLARLESEGLIGADREGRRLLQPQIVLDRWLAGYIALVRPRLLIGRFRTNDPDPEALEGRIEHELGDTVQWAWGGGAAAMRLTGYYRGAGTVLHLAEPVQDLGKRLKAIPAEGGPLIVLRVPGPIAFEGVKPRTAHPLLVYTELLAAGAERAREAAEEVATRYLKWRAR